MMMDFGTTKNPAHIGLYSGFVESAFAVCQLATTYAWAHASDKYGRRPIILFGVCGLAFSTLVLGLSRTFIQVVLARALAGFFSGNVAVIPTVLCEITDSTNHEFAFSFFTVWWPVGSVLGPLAGGMLVKPATKYPNVFRHDFWKNNPYFLPSFVVFVITFLGFVISYCILNETLYTKRKGYPTDSSAPTAYGTMARSHRTNTLCDNPSISQMLAIPIIRALCLSSCALSFVSTSFEVVFVLFCFLPIESGGLSMSTRSIGIALASSGLLAGLLQVFFMPRVLRKFEHPRIFHFSLSVWPYAFALLPALNLAVRHTTASAYAPCVLWTGIVLILSIARVGFLGYSVNMLLVRRFTPNHAALGSTNGLIQFHICFSRAFSPTFVSTLFAYSVGPHVVYNHSWVIIMVLISYGANYLSRRVVVEGEKFGQDSS